jgi:hypothetical protein
MPTPQEHMKHGTPDTGVTNVRKGMASALAAMA